MRRLTALLLVGLLGLVGTACDPQLSRKASGTFSGTQANLPFTEECSFFRQLFDATYVRRQGAPGGTFHLDGCVSVGDTPAFPYRGNFVLTAQGGARLTGTVDGVNDLSVFPISADFTLTVTQGTKRFSGATGSIELDGAWSGLQGPFDGTLTAFLRDGDGERIAL